MAKRTKDHYQARESMRYEHPIASREAILSWLKGKYRSPRLADIITHFEKSHPKQKEAIRRRVLAMIKDGQIKEKRSGRLVASPSQVMEGVVKLTAKGTGEVAIAKGQVAILPPRQMRGVCHGDRVRIRMGDETFRRKPLAVLVEIIACHDVEALATYHQREGRAWVQSLHAPNRWYIKPDRSLKEGACVEIKVKRSPGQEDHVSSCSALGSLEDASTQIKLVTRHFDLPCAWSKQVLREVASFSDDVDVMGREDLRHLPFVTVDGVDAKDFDDAVYLESIKNGYQIWVAIADVASYVTPNTALDQEAKLRGTSVYFPDYVIPMLPERLSNDLCSLRPKVDRLALVCRMTLSHSGALMASEFKKAVIRSHARMTYDELEAMRTQKTAPPSWWQESFECWQKVYTLLQDQRYAKGTLMMSIPEPRFTCKKDRVVAMKLHHQSQAQMWIEVLMVLANTAAASFLAKHQQPLLYRVHEAPAMDKLKELIQVAKQLGIVLHGETATDVFKACQKHLHQKHGDLLQTMMLRTLSQAIYHPDNIGHFGLAEPYYTHFTSPIRRYPDLWVHRLIHHTLDGEIGHMSDLVAFGQSLTDLEKRADRASWQILDRFKCLYMRGREGEVFEARVTSVHAFGFFVQLESGVEAMVHVSTLNDYFEFDAKQSRLKARSKNQVIALGSKLLVSLDGIDLVQGKMECSVSKFL